MRLTDRELTLIKKIFAVHFLQEDKLWLFGSRVNDAKKGGDIDLYIETHYKESTTIIQKRLDFMVSLKQAIGEQKIDVVINYLGSNQHLPIYDEAKNTGVKLV